MIQSYNKIYNIGNKAIDGIFDDDIILQEKVDGSQISFGVSSTEKTLMARSKGAILNFLVPEKMFVLGLEAIKELEPLLKPGYIYRGEYLAKPKHNTLFYSRIPNKHIVLFDIDAGDQHYLSPEEVEEEAKRIGLESVPCFYKGKVENYDMFRTLVDTQISFLGGAKIEGVVCKNYTKFGIDKKIMMGKFVSEEFREAHKTEWKTTSPNHGDIIQVLSSKYKTVARWNKAIQHLKEAGNLTTSLKDIPLIMKETQEDIKLECKDEIMEFLFEWAWPKIARNCIHGIPEYYKEYLIKEEFNKE